jgi:hypothetical protein
MEALMECLPGSRIPQAIYLSAALRKVPGPWSKNGASGDLTIGQLEPGDLPLVTEDMA